MKLISQFNAASYSEAELRGHLRQAFNAFATAPQGSLAQSSALLSMDNIEAEIASRSPSR
ncbi:hypothetical protein M3P21_22220 [Ruegeria sp. 2012CJ41-6]|uniref:Uncharacterized protein n=1 Tax=Ruegeria spongiae TaxID=2942209 RepID=A0ABT0Q8K2_9RHOB|nr:hypothetical protein [Ruegeria spongiae]MCL6286211.1 hypothetical protein [Ruegeria spongiae]